MLRALPEPPRRPGRALLKASRGPDEAVELIADDALLVHLEQRRVGRAAQALTPAMAPDRLLALSDGMGLASISIAA